jgi:hypothetical protein
MINLWYSYTQNGPGKVLNNFKAGLNILNIPFVDNSFSFSKNIIFSDTPQLALCDDNYIVGPNVSFPKDNEHIKSANYKYHIVPSQWVHDLFLKWLPSNKIKIWPVGIDSNYFRDTKYYYKSIDCLVYFKRRNQEDLTKIINILNSKHQTYIVLQYGTYSEEQFFQIISACRYGIVIDGTESQGIAINEMMSANLPLFVWDIEFWNDLGQEEYKVSATSVPYFDQTCGIKVSDINMLEQEFNIFLQLYTTFTPRNYIINNLSLEKQAKELINLF